MNQLTLISNDIPGWLPPSDLSLDQWRDYGSKIGQAEGTLNWIIGDWLLAADSKWGEMYEEAMELTGRDYAFLAQRKFVSKTFDFLYRYKKLSWSHHFVAAQCGNEKSLEYLQVAERDGLSTRQLRTLIEADKPPANGHNYKRDNRRSQAADIYTPQGMDACQTPAYAIDPLLPYLQEGWNIWEPAEGEGLLVEALYDSGFHVVSGDILTGQNFFDHEPDQWDCLITNPPFSIKYQWIQRCYQLGKPFALLLPVETLGAMSAQVPFEEFGIEVIFVRPRINFKMPNKGWTGGGSQFPVAWFTFGLNIGKQMTFAKVIPEDAETN